MEFKKSSLLAVVFVLCFGVSAVFAQEVNMDTLRTEVAATIIAEIRGTMAADGYEVIIKGQPTATPAPVSNTTSKSVTNSSPSFYGGYGTGYWYPTPTYYSYQARLIRQNQNYMHMAHDVEFTITWTIKNTGPLEWNTQFYLRYYKGQKAKEGDIYMLPYNVGKGDTIDISRSFRAQMEPGIYNSYWELVDDDGVVILDNIWAGWQVDDWRQ